MERYIHYLVLSLIFLSLSYQSVAQSDCDCYERLIELSKYYYEIEDYERANQTIKKAQSIKPIVEPYDHFIYAKILLKLDQKEEALDQIVRSVKKGKELEMDFEPESVKEFVMANLDTNALFIAAIERAKIYFQLNLDLEYLRLLDDIKGGDQTFRKMYRLKKITVTDALFYEFDRFSLDRIKEAIDQYGMPGVEKHGFSGFYEHIFLVLLHASQYDEKMYKEVLSIAEEANNECLASRSIIAGLVDRRLDWYHKKPLSLGQNNFYKSGNFKPISDVETVDQRRFEYNLLRLNELAKKEKRTLPEKYKKIDYPENYFCGFEFVE